MSHHDECITNCCHRPANSEDSDADTSMPSPDVQDSPMPDNSGYDAVHDKQLADLINHLAGVDAVVAAMVTRNQNQYDEAHQTNVTIKQYANLRHCAEDGLTWYDDGLNPFGCPYCMLRQKTEEAERQYDFNVEQIAKETALLKTIDELKGGWTKEEAHRQVQDFNMLGDELYRVRNELETYKSHWVACPSRTIRIAELTDERNALQKSNEALSKEITQAYAEIAALRKERDAAQAHVREVYLELNDLKAEN